MANVSPKMMPNSSNSRLKLMPAPTVIKNKPSSKPLKGSILLSNSCRYSLLASTTPAINAPSAGERPMAVISAAMPTTKVSADAVNTSRIREAAIKRNTGRDKKWPPTTIAAITPSVTAAFR